MNITDPIRRVARVNPGAIAVIHSDDTAVSYRDFDRMIDAATLRLAELGIEAGQTVGLGIVGPATLVASLALARMGVASAAILLPAERMDICLLPKSAETLPGVRCVNLDATWAQVPPPGATMPDVAAHPGGSAVCRIFTSSGTTGVPKFAAISHETMTRRVFNNGLSMGPPEPVHICMGGLGITRGYASALRIFWAGGTLVLTRSLAAIRRHRVNSMVAAPIVLQQLVAAIPDGTGPLPSLKVVEVGGSVLPTALYELARRKLCKKIVSYYGSMENGGVASAPMSLLQGDPRPVGYVHAGVEVEAVDDQGRPLPAGTEGMLRIRSDNNVTGYLYDDGSSAQAFRDGWFYTADVGAVSRDGILTLSGRDTDLINSGGIKLSPHVVEDVLLSLPQVTEAAAFGVPDRMGIVQIWAAIVAESRIDVGPLRAMCDARLADKSPKFILQMDRLPRNASGKVLRDELVKFAMSKRR